MIYRTDAKTVERQEKLETVYRAAQAFLDALDTDPGYPTRRQEDLRRALRALLPQDEEERMALKKRLELTVRLVDDGQLYWDSTVVVDALTAEEIEAIRPKGASPEALMAFDVAQALHEKVREKFFEASKSLWQKVQAKFR